MTITSASHRIVKMVKVTCSFTFSNDLVAGISPERPNKIPVTLISILVMVEMAKLVISWKVVMYPISPITTSETSIRRYIATFGHDPFAL